MSIFILFQFAQLIVPYQSVIDRFRQILSFLQRHPTQCLINIPIQIIGSLHSVTIFLCIFFFSNNSILALTSCSDDSPVFHEPTGPPETHQDAQAYTIHHHCTRRIQPAMCLHRADLGATHPYPGHNEYPSHPRSGDHAPARSRSARLFETSPKIVCGGRLCEAASFFDSGSLALPLPAAPRVRETIIHAERAAAPSIRGRKSLHSFC